LRPEHGEEERLRVSRLFFLFVGFYFTKYFTFKPAPFDELMYQNFQDLATGSAKEAAWIAYRDGAKAFIVELGLVRLIAREQVISALRHNGKDVSAWAIGSASRSTPMTKLTRRASFSTS
jgi:hypothetical protein